MAKSLTIFGDSILKGIVFNATENKYGLCAKALRDSYEKDQYTINRICHMGSKIDDGLFWIDRTLAKEQPDNILLEFGGNDCMYNWNLVSEQPGELHEALTPPDEFEEKYQLAIDKCKASNVNVMIANLVPINAEKYMNFISKDLSYDNILQWLGDTSMLYRWHESYNDIVERLARKNNCQIVDLRHKFLLSHRFPSLICDDGIHPTIDGHILIENTILQAI